MIPHAKTVLTAKNAESAIYLLWICLADRETLEGSFTSVAGFADRHLPQLVNLVQLFGALASRSRAWQAGPMKTLGCLATLWSGGSMANDLLQSYARGRLTARSFRSSVIKVAFSLLYLDLFLLGVLKLASLGLRRSIVFVYDKLENLGQDEACLFCVWAFSLLLLIIILENALTSLSVLAPEDSFPLNEDLLVALCEMVIANFLAILARSYRGSLPGLTSRSGSLVDRLGMGFHWRTAFFVVLAVLVIAADLATKIIPRVQYFLTDDSPGWMDISMRIQSQRSFTFV